MSGPDCEKFTVWTLHFCRKCRYRLLSDQRRLQSCALSKATDRYSCGRKQAGCAVISDQTLDTHPQGLVVRHDGLQERMAETFFSFGCICTNHTRILMAVHPVVFLCDQLMRHASTVRLVGQSRGGITQDESRARLVWRRAGRMSSTIAP